MKHPFTQLVMKLTFCEHEWEKFYDNKNKYLEKHPELGKSQREALKECNGSKINDEIDKEHANPDGVDDCALAITHLAVVPNQPNWPTHP